MDNKCTCRLPKKYLNSFNDPWCMNCDKASPPTPPVNESWREKYHKILNDNSNRPLFNDLERFIERQISTARQEERERILKLQKQVEELKMTDAEHCSCLGYAIDIIENPDSDRTFVASDVCTKLQEMK